MSHTAASLTLGGDDVNSGANKHLPIFLPIYIFFILIFFKSCFFQNRWTRLSHKHDCQQVGKRIKYLENSSSLCNELAKVVGQAGRTHGGPVKEAPRRLNCRRSVKLYDSPWRHFAAICCPCLSKCPHIARQHKQLKTSLKHVLHVALRETVCDQTRINLMG